MLVANSLAATEVRETEVGSQLNSMAIRMTELENLVESFADRLGPVLNRSSGLKTKDGGSPPHAVLCPLAEDIRNQNERLAGAVENLYSLLQQVEV